MSDKLIDRIDALPGCPSVDPHGDPIPDGHGEMRKPRPVLNLRDSVAGESYRIARVGDQDEALLRLVKRHGLKPGTRITVDECDPVVETVTLRPRDAKQMTLGGEPRPSSGSSRYARRRDRRVDVTTMLRPGMAARWLATLTLGALLLPAAAPAKKKQPTDNEAAVVGNVVNQQEEAIAGVRVTVTSELQESFRIEATTDEDGAFTFRVTDPEGEYAFRLEAEGYAPFEGKVPLTAGEEASIGFQLLDAATGMRQEATRAFNTGAEAFNSNDFATAKAKFLEAAELDSEMVEPHQGLAEIYYREEDLAAAAAAVERVLAERSDDTGALTLAYTIYRELGNEERTEALVDALAKTDKAKPLARQIYNDGVEAAQSGAADNAIERFRRAAALDPELSQAYSSEASILYNEERYGEAKAALDKLFALDPENRQGRRINFLIHDALDDQAEAAAALESYLAVDPDGAVDLMYQRADMDFRDGNTPKAIAALERILELKPDMPRAHYTLGLCHAGSDKAQAKVHLERFLELAPDDPEAATAKEMLSYF